MHIFKRPCTFPFLPLYYFYAEFQDRITTVSIIFPKSADARIFAKEEVINMLIAEYDYDTDIAVQRRESLMIGLQQGLAEGKSLGFAEGSHQTKLETARNLCVMGLSVENIAKATGLTPAEVEAIK